MSMLRLPGLSTGIDTSALIQQLMAVRSRSVENQRLRQSEMQTKRGAYDQLRGAIRSLNNSISQVSSAENLKSFNTNLSNSDMVGVNTGTNANEGTHTLQIKQRAAAETWIHEQSSFRYATDYVGQGRFIYSYNGYERVISTLEDETTLEDLVNLINNDENNPGVTASLLNRGGSFHLMLSGRDTGAQHQISVNDSNTELWTTGSEMTTTHGRRAQMSTRIIRLEQFEGSLAGDESITITGTKNDGSAVDMELHINDNTTVEHLIDAINDAYEGTATAVLERGRIRLLDSTSGQSQMTFEMAYNAGSGESQFDIPGTNRATRGGSVTAGLEGFEPDGFIKTQSAQDSLIKINGYPTGSDNWIANSSNTISDAIPGVTLNLRQASEYNENTDTWETVDISITKDTAAVKQRLEAMVSAFNETISLIRELTEFNVETEQHGVLSSERGVGFMRTNLRSPFNSIATGFIETIDSFSRASDIGLTVDGRGMLELDESELEQAINEDYQGVVNLLSGSGIGTSSNSSIQFFNASGRTEPGTYDVRVETDDQGNITNAWVKTQTEQEWRKMTVRGDIMQGTLDLSSDDPERGLQLMLHWDGTEYTSENPLEATVRVKRGITVELENTLDDFLSKDGRIAIGQRNLDRQIEALQGNIDRERDRIQKEEERLVLRFARLERTLAELEGQMQSANILAGSHGGSFQS